LIKAQKLSTIIPQITIKVADPAKEDEQFMNNTNAKIKTSRLRDLNSQIQPVSISNPSDFKRTKDC